MQYIARLNSPLAQPAQVPSRLGTHLTGSGADFAIVATRASAVELCLVDVDSTGKRSETRIRLRGPINGVWHGHVPGVRTGQRYGYRIHGPWDPAAGLLHNPAKLMLDPYARGVEGEVYPRPELHIGNHGVACPIDTLPFAPLGVITTQSRGVLPSPRTPWEHTVIYEAHVIGLTKQLPSVPPDLRGTYAGVAHPATIAHLKKLGVTAIELLPVHAKMDEQFLTGKGLGNYWGYSTLSYFAPEPSYATATSRARGAQGVVDEIKGMVSLLHEAGIEVLLDVVYNHTCEGGDALAVSWRGIDNTGYYAHDGSAPARLADFTGCGNSLDFRRTRVVQMVLDSLRYWATEIGVDGFRYDLAVTLGRSLGEFSPRHAFFVALATDPVLSTLKHISEPWDLGPGGWRTGQFPIPFADWNDRFRDTVRQFWVADARSQSYGYGGAGLADLATRLTGSVDLFGHGQLIGGRGPLASVNYVTAHDGFTMHDLVSYDRKHNLANLEDNRDGTENNRSWNFGHEGEIDEKAAGAGLEAVHIMRLRSHRNLLGTLLLSAGVPMLVAGDEFGRTQQGNNNAYCQDSPISWIDWQLSEAQECLLETSRYLLKLRREHPVLRPSAFAAAIPLEIDGQRDQIVDTCWYGPDGQRLADSVWHDPDSRVITMLRSGWAWGGRDAVLVLNGSLAAVDVVLPKGRGVSYELLWDSAWPRPDSAERGVFEPGDEVSLEGLTMQLYVTTSVARIASE
ncbi:glycogen debranching protein GlgX [Buchananella felis]|uniref:glycogen debranching protein GlgX n=1 Tax=Buchananella felis TaxID=3231492 RepID=UPI003526F4A8